MEKGFSISLATSGDKVIIKDTTEWGVGDDAIDRNSIALVAGLTKFDENIGWTYMNPINQTSGISYSPSFTNNERSEFQFNLSRDGYYVCRFIFAPIASLATTEGSVYYNVVENQLYLRNETDWVAVTEKELFESTDPVISDIDKGLGFSPILEKSLNRIWQRYENDSFPVKGKDYTNFYTGYGMLIGAISSLRQQNFTEYDRKIVLANRLVDRWK